ncbi:MAG TPA: hypothetical protein VFG86_06065 [Chloroflexota bacterium]|jgi:hypothetical protein|nr:hypothetical protein [Chloroflexota bacterium]
MLHAVVHGGLRIGFLILVLALLPLPFLSPSSAEFVVSAMAAIMSGLFIAGLVALGLKGRER